MKNIKRKRIAAVIVKGKKILLVGDGGVDFFSIPGGAPEKGEGDFDALRRELHEELDIILEKAIYYFSFDLVNVFYNIPQTDKVYLAYFKGEPRASSEVTKMGWFSKEEILQKKIKTPKEFFDKLLPKLIEDKII